MGKKRTQKRSEITVFGNDPHEDADGASRNLKPIPDMMKQGPYETQDQFIRRLNQLVGRAMGEAEIEERYDVDFCTKNGPAPSKQRSEKKQERRRIRDLKRRAKKKQKQNLTQETINEKRREKVKFGEVVHEPPKMTEIKHKFEEQIRKMKEKKAKSIRHLS